LRKKGTKMKRKKEGGNAKKKKGGQRERASPYCKGGQIFLDLLRECPFPNYIPTIINKLKHVKMSTQV